MTKVTYLFGAGASCHALPLAKDVKTSTGEIIGLSRALMTLASVLSQEKDKLNPNTKAHHFCNTTIKQFEKLARESEEFNTVDTYAKYLFLNNESELSYLKITLSKFFMLEQYAFRKFDKRYLVFLTTILNNFLFPDNINILTWNYDFQLEIAASYFTKEDFTSHSSGISVTSKHSPPLVSYFPPVGIRLGMHNTEYKVVHLNGIAGHYQRGNAFQNKLIYTDAGKDFIAACNDISHTANQSDDFLHFAWENHPQSMMALEIAETIIQGTDILIVIGYSFPFFNRNIDKKIFDVLKANPHLKIYYQDPVADGSFLYSQFKIKDSTMIKQIKKVDQFFVPFEL
ncbi:MAG: hypothetical protein R2764_19415 [Bacteroidales bacterium]